MPGLPDDAGRPVFLEWEAAGNFAWGIVGLHIALHWCRERRLLPVFPVLEPKRLFVDPLRGEILRPAIRAAAAIAPKMSAASARAPVELDMPVVYAVGNGAAVSALVRGKRRIGRYVFEDTKIDRDAVTRLRSMDVLTVISRWNADVASAAAGRPVALNHEGVDASTFFPGPRSGLMDSSRFYVFSGGKAEYRKGNDLVLAAFGVFARRHPEAVLVTAWQSPFASIGAGLRGVLDAPLCLDRTGQRVDVQRWASDNGIDADRVVDVGMVPNFVMPAVLREMDCAVCASRAEGGTNLPVMEAMACGVPAVIPFNTGMKDLVDGDNAIVLREQAPVASRDGVGTDGWGESSVDEIVAALEAIFASTELRRRVAAAGVASVRQRTWAAHADRLASLVLDA